MRNTTDKQIKVLTKWIKKSIDDERRYGKEGNGEKANAEFYKRQGIKQALDLIRMNDKDFEQEYHLAMEDGKEVNE